ncbi:MAG: ABC transporter permease [Prevotellaceae bacterium]|jgi:hypothetical protein|nr:ABC transporter permease [Prevotellaceae bacterium]
MITLYLKQAWILIKQQRLFTGIYVLGTGLSIALVMTVFIIFYVKFAPIYPEYNRNRTLVVKSVKVTMEDPKSTNLWCGTVSDRIAGMMADLPHLEAVTATATDWQPKFITLPDGIEQLETKVRYADAGFWQVFTFRFLYGKPFTQADIDARRPELVIPQSLSERLFATADAVGREVQMDGMAYRVCGVVADASSATPASSGDVWMPASFNSSATSVYSDNHEVRLLGDWSIYLTAAAAADKEALKEEVRDLFRKYNQNDEHFVSDFSGQPDDYWASTFRFDACNAPDLTNTIGTFALLFLALLIIPGMNLSGMVASRMDNRIAEMGIRKTYGATRGNLISQVLWENLLLTCLGGLLGLLLSYLIVLTSSHWILTLFDTWVEPDKAPQFTFEMLFNPLVFAAAFLLCVALNLISAFVPTAWALRHPIIQSIQMKN